MKRWILSCSFLALTATAYAGQVTSFDDIQFWAGTGANRAAIAIDWDADSTADQSLVWGFRWDGTASGEDMLMAVVAADPRLFIKGLHGGFGYSLNGVGYDDGDGIFGIDDGTVFNSSGIAETVAPSDAAQPTDSGDRYAEGWFAGFWSYGLSSGNPFDGGSWVSALTGVTDEELTDGDWNSLAFTQTFGPDSFARNAYAAPVPEPSSLALIASGLLLVVMVRRFRAAPLRSGAVLLVFALATPLAFASPFATDVVSYTPGTPIGVGNPAPYQTDGTQALGSPTRDTLFGSQVGVFYPAFGSGELAIIGAGGELTVKFDHHVENDPANPFGIDLLVFGNAGYVRGSNGLATGIVAEPAQISVSQDGQNWFDIVSAFADTAFPTLGYSDTAYTGQGNAGGTILTDFTRPVDPAFNGIGHTEVEINAAYAGAGGGTGIDLSLVNLDWIQYVRITQPADATWSSEIDAFADVAPVPEPASYLLFALAIPVVGRKMFCGTLRSAN